MQRHIQFGSQRIDFSLQYLNRKSLGIKIHPEGRVEVLAPADAKENEVFEKIRTRAPWILKQLDHFNTFRPSTPPRRFVNGETHLYLGRQYRLKVVPATENTIKAYSGQVFIYATQTSVKCLRLQLQAWYRQKAVKIFEQLLDETYPAFSKYKIARPSLIVRTMSKRWGSCTSSGKIILNTELIKAPRGSIEYVIIHELCHLVHHNHTKAFFDLQSNMMPDWKKWKDRLEYALV